MLEVRSSRRRQGAAEMTIAGREAARTAALAMPRAAATQAGDRPMTVGDEVVLRQATEAEPISSPLESKGAVGVLLAGGADSFSSLRRCWPPTSTHPFSVGACEASVTTSGVKFGGSRFEGGGSLSGGRIPGQSAERARESPSPSSAPTASSTGSGSAGELGRRGGVGALVAV